MNIPAVTVQHPQADLYFFLRNTVGRIDAAGARLGTARAVTCTPGKNQVVGGVFLKDDRDGLRVPHSVLVEYLREIDLLSLPGKQCLLLLVNFYVVGGFCEQVLQFVMDCVGELDIVSQQHVFLIL